MKKTWFCRHSCFPALLHNCEQQSVVTCFNKKATPHVFPTVLNYTSNNDRHWIYLLLFSINRLFLHTLSHVLFLCDHVVSGMQTSGFPRHVQTSQQRLFNSIYNLPSIYTWIPGMWEINWLSKCHRACSIQYCVVVNFPCKAQPNWQ